MTSLSIPYSFMCCKPQPSFTRLGMIFLRRPVKFGVWYMRTSTRSGNSATRGAKRDAHDGSGDSRVPRIASVSMETLRSGPLLRRASRMVETSSYSDFPIYKVERKILLFAFRILLLSVSQNSCGPTNTST